MNFLAATTTLAHTRLQTQTKIAGRDFGRVALTLTGAIGHDLAICALSHYLSASKRKPSSNSFCARTAAIAAACLVLANHANMAPLFAQSISRFKETRFLAAQLQLLHQFTRLGKESKVGYDDHWTAAFSEGRRHGTSMERW